jgi:hypothetical protein
MTTDELNQAMAAVSKAEDEWPTRGTSFPELSPFHRSRSTPTTGSSRREACAASQ